MHHRAKWGQFRRMIVRQSLGMGAIAFLLMLKASGAFQPFELKQLDWLLRHQPKERAEDRIVLITLDQAYLDTLQAKHPERPNFEYQDLADLTQLIWQYQPTVVGLDIPAPQLSGNGQENLVRLFRQYPDLIAVEKAFPPAIPPIPGIPSTQLASNDFPVDPDGNVRRTFLAAYTKASKLKPSEFKQFLAFRLAEIYLKKQHNIDVDEGDRDRQAPQFGSVEIPRIKRDQEPYLGDDSINGIQTLIHFRRQASDFQAITASELIEQSTQTQHIKNKIVIVGITAPTLATYLTTIVPEIRLEKEETLLKNEILGIDLQAHATSQILSSVLEGKVLAKGINQVLSYALLIAAGMVGCCLGRVSHNIFVSLLGLLLAGLGLWIGSFLIFLISGIYVPPIANLLALTITGLSYTLLLQQEISEREISERKILELEAQTRESLLQERRKAIEDVFGEIHNGPLQLLSILLRQIQDEEVAIANVETQIKAINQQIRIVGEHLKQQSQTEINPSLWRGSRQIEINQPLADFLYDVYSASLQENWPNLKNLKLKSRAFESLNEDQISHEEKAYLSRFLEEAIYNVGKHAHGATRLIVLGKREGGNYSLSIEDNGRGEVGDSSALDKDPHSSGGTVLAEKIAERMQGNFSREPLSPQGCRCVLTWPITHRKTP